MPGDDLPLPDEDDDDTWLRLLMHVSTMGEQAEVIEMEEEDIQALRRHFASPEATELRDRLYLATGGLISATAAVEMELNPLISFLLNPLEPERVKQIVIPLATSAKLKMLRGLFPPKWESGKELLHAVQKLSEFRNRLAHGTWATSKIASNGTIDYGTFLSGFDTRRMITTRDSVTEGELAEWQRVAHVLRWTLNLVLRYGHRPVLEEGNFVLWDLRELLTDAGDAKDELPADWTRADIQATVEKLFSGAERAFQQEAADLGLDDSSNSQG